MIFDEVLEKTREPRVALINEDLCIGCVKCIKACPFDTIVGAAKLMHTVIESECTGCGLCVPVCPMDCIDLIPAARTEIEYEAKIPDWRQRYENHEQRLTRDAEQKAEDYEQLRLAQAEQEKLSAKKQAIAEAIARVKAKRNKQ